MTERQIAPWYRLVVIGPCQKQPCQKTIEADRQLHDSQVDAESAVIAGSTRTFWRPEYVFVPIFLLFGAIFVFLIPPGWNSDEPAHIMRAQQLSTGKIFADVNIGTNGAKEIGGDIPVGIRDLLVATRVWGEGGVFDSNFTVGNVHALVSTEAETGQATVSVDFRNTAIYSPIAYLPQMPAFWVGKILSLSFASIVLLGRLFGLITVAAAVFFAIRLTPIGKWVFFAVALLPAFVSQAASFSADPAVLGFATLFAAYLMRVILQERAPRTGQYAALLAIGVGLSLTKVAYAPLLVLVFLIPLCNRQARTRKDFLSAGLGLLMAVLPALVWSKLVGPATTVSLNPAADPSNQLSGIIDHPIAFARVVYRTFLTTELPGDLLSSFFGNFVWLTTPLPTAYVCLAVYALIASVLVRDPRETRWLDPGPAIWYFRGGLLLVAAGTVLVVAAGIYITFSAVDARVVEGLQGRYFLAVLPLAMLAFYGNTLLRQRAVNLSIVVVVVVVLLGGVAALVNRLY